MGKNRGKCDFRWDFESRMMIPEEEYRQRHPEEYPSGITWIHAVVILAIWFGLVMAALAR